MHSYQFCPYCGNKYSPEAIRAKEFFFSCQTCGRHVFENQVVTASALIIQEGRLLLVRRAHEPQKGMLDIPGGYCQPQEHPEEACKRELREELGVEIEITDLHGVYAPTPYEYQGNIQYNCDLFYTATLLSNDVVPADDVASVEWVSLDNLPDESELAFSSLQQAVREFREN